MKPEYKVEGDKFIVKFEENKSIDTDNDGESSVKLFLSGGIELDGSEVLAELLKSAPLLQKAQELLQKIGIGVQPEVKPQEQAPQEPIA